MPVYQPNIPTGTVNLDVDYLNVRDNFQQANIVYGTNHYPLDNATPNQGFHNHVTMPIVVNNPPDGLPPATSSTTCEFYTFQQYGAMGLLQYSRGPSNAVPTPVTSLNSSVTPIVIPPVTSVNVMDFTGIALAIAEIYIFDSVSLLSSPTSIGAVFWGPSGFSISNVIGGNLGLHAVSTGNILQIRNSSTTVTFSNVYWTLQFKRVQ